MQEPLVAYGSESVTPSEKTRRVGEIFSRVAKRYDVMNDAMSLGTHRLWKARMVASMRPAAGMRFLDLASGTGDIAIRIGQSLPSNADKPSHITLSDINPAMLAEGKKRWVDVGMLGIPRLEARWVTASAETLPFPDMSYDHASMAFGIRNVARTADALAEIHRVLTPGGKLTVMEFVPDVDGWIAPLYESYSDHIIPKMGAWIAGDETSYRYLVESIRSFPPCSAFMQMMERAGFKQVKLERLSFGMVGLFSGYRV